MIKTRYLLFSACVGITVASGLSLTAKSDRMETTPLPLAPSKPAETTRSTTIQAKAKPVAVSAAVNTVAVKTVAIDTPAPDGAAVRALDAENLSSRGLSAAAYAFKKEVYQQHVARGARSGRPRIYDLPASKLASIPGTNIKMRRDAAKQLGRLLTAARADLARDLAATANDATSRDRRARARRVQELAVNNAYRSASRQFGIWDRNFKKYYEATQEQRRAAPGGEHGVEAATLLRDYIAVRVASPGYSNHQGGIAVDFALRLKDANELGASMAQSDPWKESWFWRWLKQRAGEFGFVEYEPEPWHWEYKPAPTNRVDG